MDTIVTQTNFLRSDFSVAAENSYRFYILFRSEFRQNEKKIATITQTKRKGAMREGTTRPNNHIEKET